MDKASKLISERKVRKQLVVRNPKIAPAIINFYAAEQSGVLFKYALFKGNLSRVSYSIGSANKEDKDNNVRFNCTIKNAKNNYSRIINTKKLSDVVNLNLPVEDGDVLVVEGAEEDIIFKDVSISILFNAKEENENI